MAGIGLATSCLWSYNLSMLWQVRDEWFIFVHVVLISLSIELILDFFQFYFILFFSFFKGSACLTTDYEVAGSIPGIPTFKCQVGLERGPPSFVSTIG